VPVEVDRVAAQLGVEDEGSRRAEVVVDRVELGDLVVDPPSLAGGQLEGHGAVAEGHLDAARGVELPGFVHQRGDVSNDSPFREDLHVGVAEAELSERGYVLGHLVAGGHDDGSDL
jgi:hypothetical protein